MLSFVRSLKGMVRSSNAVAVVTFPPNLLSPSSCKRWQHMADTLLSVKAIPGQYQLSHLLLLLPNILSTIIYMNLSLLIDFFNLDHSFRRGQGIGKTPYWLPGHGWPSECAQSSTS